MNDKVKEILLKQMELLQEESQKNKGEIGYKEDLTEMSKAIAAMAAAYAHLGF